VDGKLERRDVRLIAWDGEDAILDGDLSEGDTVLVTRLTEATEGVNVREPASEPLSGEPANSTANPDDTE